MSEQRLEEVFEEMIPIPHQSDERVTDERSK